MLIQSLNGKYILQTANSISDNIAMKFRSSRNYLSKIYLDFSSIALRY